MTTVDDNEKRYELFFAIVCPVGVDKSQTVKFLSRALSDIGKYEAHEIKLSTYLRKIDVSLADPMPEDQRINAHMDVGNKLRRESKMENAVAVLGLAEIKELREKYKNPQDDVAFGHAFIFNSIKHKGELKALRTMYGEHFYVISVYESTENRCKTLIERIKSSQPKKGFLSTNKKEEQEVHKKAAQQLIERDQFELNDPYGQSVRKTFPLADLFVAQDQQEGQINRFVRLLFGARFVTPTPDEYGMYFAHAAALRTSDLSRQVGAVVMTKDGEILTVGCNEVPKVGGGAYWEESTGSDHRDFQNQEYDPNVRHKYMMLQELFEKLKKTTWLETSLREKSEEDLINMALYDDSNPFLQGTRIDSLLEFGRIVHAEMHAITEAAKRGISLCGTILHCTTYPCHMCARHIIASGIERVVFIEPYPKSLAQDLYPGMVKVDGFSSEVDEKIKKETDKVVQFDAFIGVSPRQYSKLFKMIADSRKDGRGKVTDKQYVENYPRISKPEFTYAATEDTHINLLLKKISELTENKGDSQ